jgi:hypothetical protein
MFVGGGVDGLPPDSRSFSSGYGDVDIDPVVTAGVEDRGLRVDVRAGPCRRDRDRSKEKIGS